MKNLTKKIFGSLIIGCLASSSLLAADASYTQMLKEELEKFNKSLPISFGGPNIALTKTYLENNIVNYNVVINAKSFEKDTKREVTAASINELKPVILSTFKPAQVNGICSNDQTMKIINQGFTFSYNYSFDNGIKIGSNTIGLKNCKNLFTKK